jgi:YHS domain-containing protein
MRTLFAAFCCLSLLAACTQSSSAPAGHPPDKAAAVAVENGLTRVTDASQVCMVTNQYMGVVQIPIEVEGKTYFGCCEICKGRLANEPATRQATDPVTGESVDKAMAVIARQADGKLLYFASADTFARYRQ